MIEPDIPEIQQLEVPDELARELASTGDREACVPQAQHAELAQQRRSHELADDFVAERRIVQRERRQSRQWRREQLGELGEPRHREHSSRAEVQHQGLEDGERRGGEPRDGLRRATRDLERPQRTQLGEPNDTRGGDMFELRQRREDRVEVERIIRTTADREPA